MICIRCLRKVLVHTDDRSRLQKRKKRQIVKLTKEVRLLERKNIKFKYKSRWEDYQTSKDQSDVRWEKVRDFINENGVRTVLEFGANQGNLARYVCEKCAIENWWATDYDAGAVNVCYEQCKGTDFPIMPIVLSATNYRKILMNKLRFASECVVLLALSHHLILAQYVNMDAFFELLHECTKKYIVIEFMPYGLWDGHSRVPTIPDWYTKEWFVERLGKYFRVLSCEKLMENRVMICAEKR